MHNPNEKKTAQLEHLCHLKLIVGGVSPPQPLPYLDAVKICLELVHMALMGLS